MEMPTGPFNLEHISNEERDSYKLLLEQTSQIIIDINKDRPASENGAGNELLQKFHDQKAKNELISSWTGFGEMTRAENLETTLKLLPGQKLVGIKTDDDKVWPIQSEDKIKNIPIDSQIVLNQKDVSTLYIACGGDKDKAETMFKSSK